MNFQDRNPRWAMVPQRIRGMFNLNDPRWGRGEDKPEDGNRPEPERPPVQPSGGRGRDSGSAGQPPDLDELWRDLNRKLGGCSVTRAVARGGRVVVMVAAFSQT